MSVGRSDRRESFDLRNQFAQARRNCNHVEMGFSLVYQTLEPADDGADDACSREMMHELVRPGKNSSAVAISAQSSGEPRVVVRREISK